MFKQKGEGRIGRETMKFPDAEWKIDLFEETARIRVLRSRELSFKGLTQSLKREQQDVDIVAQGALCEMIITEGVNFQVETFGGCSSLCSLRLNQLLLNV